MEVNPQVMREGFGRVVDRDKRWRKITILKLVAFVKEYSRIELELS